LTDFHGEEAKQIKVQIRVERMSRYFDDYPGFKTKTTPAKRCATQCMSQWDEILSEEVHTGYLCLFIKYLFIFR
jgi:hypothetical protein